MANAHQSSYTGPTLFPATNSTLFKTITAKTPIPTEIWQTLMQQLNKVNQHNKLLKKGYKKNVQQSLPTKSGKNN